MTWRSPKWPYVFSVLNLDMTASPFETAMTLTIALTPPPLSSIRVMTPRDGEFLRLADRHLRVCSVQRVEICSGRHGASLADGGELSGPVAICQGRVV